MTAKILAVGDAYITPEVFQRELAQLAKRAAIQVIALDEERAFTPTTLSDMRIREYAGSPSQLIEAIGEAEILACHAAPVTAAVLDAAPALRLLCCARGGPVNVDVAAATERSIPVISTPGKNAESVADLTLCFMIMLARGLPQAQRFLTEGGQLGLSTFEGARFFGHDLGGHALGLVGYGNVGRRVARRALAFGVTVLVYDPFVDPSLIEQPGVSVSNLPDMVAQADFISLHARATAQNANLFGTELFGLMKRGAYFINTARETLVDEDALYAVLTSGHLAGAALDVLKTPPKGTESPLRGLDTVIITPHVGGATYETSARGVAMLATQIEHYLKGEPLENVCNNVGR